MESAGQSVTVTLTKDNFNDPFKPIIGNGAIIKIRGQKRLCLKVKQASHSGATLYRVYHPSPKSRLKNKSVFSKVKLKII